MAVKPITGTLRRSLILNLSISLGLSFAGASWFWYGFHVPRTKLRDAYYKKLEEEKAAKASS